VFILHRLLGHPTLEMVTLAEANSPAHQHPQKMAKTQICSGRRPLCQ
jgi:hypothetical protein